MAATNFELKHYQAETLNAFQTYLQKVNTMGARLAFMDMTIAPYNEAPAVSEGTPYVCLRVPTGGGKTVMAAHSIGIGAATFLQSSNPMVLWLVPSTPIREQTVAALKNLEHPYRAALTEYFGDNVRILTKDEAFSLTRADAEGGACVIVSTIQAFRIEEKEGRKVYEDAGALMDHFSGLDESQIARLEKVDGTNRPIASLANVLRMHRPLVIVDEAHNARSPLSFDTLSRFDPSLIAEFTATPQIDHDPTKDKYASNVIHSVSAAALKAEQMIKLPIRLTTDQDWQRTIGGALDCRANLEDAAKAEFAETGEYIRPIILFQAQSKSKNDDTRIVPEKLKKYLIEDKQIPEEQIATSTGSKSELDDIDISSPECPIRYIITVQKLREGWDCPFAYVLCSVEEQKSSTAVEQILGRVLRMPNAKLKMRDALNRAYAYVASANFNAVAKNLRDGLVEGNGFDPYEAPDLVKPQQGFDYDAIADQTDHESEQMELEPDDDAKFTKALDSLPDKLKRRVSFDAEKKVLSFRGQMSKENRNLLQLALAPVKNAERVIDRLYTTSNNIQTSAAQEEDKPPFIVPQLAIMKQGVLTLFQEDHFLDLPWQLQNCDASKIVELFSIADESTEGEIDINDKGRVEVQFVKRMQGELDLVVQEPAWTEPRLINWLDRGIKHPDVTKPSAILFISQAIEALKAKGITLDELARNKHDLKNAMSQLIGDYREERESENYNALFAVDAQVDFSTSSEFSIIFDQQNYSYNQPYKGAHKFNKHYTEIIGDLKPNGEEFECAQYLDQMDEVDYWVRNVDRKPNSFWLQLPSGKFYPDFVALLKDGRILVVEYKGAHIFDNPEEQAKLKIGNVWAEASCGECLFSMPTNRNFSVLSELVK